MIKFDMCKEEIDFTKIAKLLEDKKEDYIIISKNDKPVLRVTLYENNREGLFGCAKDIVVPDDFDDIDITNDFDTMIFPE